MFFHSDGARRRSASSFPSTHWQAKTANAHEEPKPRCRPWLPTKLEDEMSTDYAIAASPVFINKFYA